MEGTVEVQISTTRDRWCWNKIIGWSKCSSGWDFEIAAMFVLKGWMTSPLIQFVILLSWSKCLRFRQEIMWFFFNSYVISSGYHFKSSFFHIKALWKTCLYKGMSEKKLSVLLFSIRPTVGGGSEQMCPHYIFFHFAVKQASAFTQGPFPILVLTLRLLFFSPLHKGVQLFLW